MDIDKLIQENTGFDSFKALIDAAVLYGYTPTCDMTNPSHRVIAGAFNYVASQHGLEPAYQKNLQGDDHD